MLSMGRLRCKEPSILHPMPLPPPAHLISFSSLLPSHAARVYYAISGCYPCSCRCLIIIAHAALDQYLRRASTVVRAPQRFWQIASPVVAASWPWRSSDDDNKHVESAGALSIWENQVQPSFVISNARVKVLN